MNESALLDCREALQSSNVAAFLRVIRAGESSQDDSAYSTVVGGGRFDAFSDHPRRMVWLPALKLNSSAAGAYQFLGRTWDECRDALGLPDFSPASQDLAAVYLIRRRGALADVLAGEIPRAVTRCNAEWASLPGSPYGQPTRTLAQVLAVYRQWGGKLASETAAATDQLGPRSPIEPEPMPVQPDPPRDAAGAGWPFPKSNRPERYAPAGEADPFAPDPSYRPEEASMPIAPIVGALLPSLIEAVPKLGKLFGSGSAVAERNVKAAELAMGIVQQATGAVNAQAAVETIKADPAKAQAAVRAIEAQWLELTEAGGDGISGARRTDAATAERGDMLRSPSFWITLALLPLVYMVVGSVVGLWGGEWPSDVRAAIATAVVSLIVGGAAGYYWGQTTSRNRTEP